MEKQRGAKSLTLSLRLDPKTKFILDFVARIKGQSITTVVERAIKETAYELPIGDRPDRWSDFWDPSEGVRTLNLIANPHYPTTFDEDDLKAFTADHWEFFYSDCRNRQPRRDFLDILWPNMEKYLGIWRETKRSDYWAAGAAMKADLIAARLVAPDWPRKSPARASGLDDEIPF